MGMNFALSAEAISALLSTKRFGRSVRILPECESTNALAKRSARGDAADGTVYLTEWQSGGYGRNAQSWHAAPGEDIALSLILRPDVGPDRCGDLSLWAALAVVRALQSVCGLDAAIKWPNDILIGGKKCCGILSEMATMQGTIAYIVLGVGIDVNAEALPDDIAAIATTLHRESGQRWDRNAIVAAVLNELESLLDSAWHGGDRAALFAEYAQKSATLGKRVRLAERSGGEALTGRAVGIAEDGALLLESDDGQTQAIHAGALSLTACESN